MKRTLLLLARALALRCPACGRAPLFASWFTMHPRCPACGFRVEREEGYFLGAMAFNLIAAELLFIAGFVLALKLTWPTPPWTLLTYASALGVVLFPVAFFPFSRTLWLAFDLLFQPARRDEYQARGEAPPRGRSPR